MDKQTKVINKICRDVGKVKNLVQTIAKEFNISQNVFMQPAESVNETESETQSLQKQKANTIPKSKTFLDEQLKEANSFLKQVGEWLVQFAKVYKQTSKRLDMS